MTIHGGNEYFPHPRPVLKKICRFFIDRGADAVICHHAHVPGAYEFYRDKPIFYSLGNLIFDHPNPPEGWDQGYAVRMEYDVQSKGLQSHKIIPYTQSVDQGGIRKIQGSEKELFINMIEGYKDTLSDEKLYEMAWDSFCKQKSPGLLLQNYSPVIFRGIGLIHRRKIFETILLPASSLLRRENILSCESHYELLLSIIRKKNG